MNYLENATQRIINDIRICLKNGAYISAFNTALTIPDIFSQLDKSEPNFNKSSHCYKNWLKNYLLPIKPNYRHLEDQSFIDDIYALRCAFLHNASNNIENQSARKIISKFKITYSYKARLGHLSGGKGLEHINDFPMSEEISLKDNQTVHILENKTTGEKRQFLFETKTVIHFNIYAFCRDITQSLEYYVEKNHNNTDIQKNASHLFLMDSGEEAIDFRINVDPDF